MHTKQIVSKSMHLLMEDTTYVKISIATSFIHAMIFNLFILFYLFSYSSLFAETTPLGSLVHGYLDLVSLESSMIGRFIVLGVILFIGYELLPPIGEAALIYYLNDESGKKDGFHALAKGLYKFFPMLEFGVSTSLFKTSFILLIVIRLILFDLRDNTLIIILMSIWITISFFVTLLLPYSKMLICLEGMPFFEAMKRSTHLAIQNFMVTLKFVIINALLSIRFIINMAIIIGIPIGLVTLGARLGLQNIRWLNFMFLIVLVGLVFLAAYIEGLIEGFFTSARWRIYTGLHDEESQQHTISSQE